MLLLMLRHSWRSFYRMCRHWSMSLKSWSISFSTVSASGLKELYCTYDLNYPYKKAHKMLWCWFRNWSNYEIHIFQIIHWQIDKVLLHTAYPSFKVIRINCFSWMKNQWCETYCKCFFFDSTNWKNFSHERNFSCHSFVLSYWHVLC